MAFNGKVALITGGGSGIGRATAIALARAGATVVIGNRNREQGQAVVAEISAIGGRADFLRTDVSRVADVQALVQHAVQTFGRLDIAFNNAGIEGDQKPLHEQDLEAANQVIDVNLKGIFWSMKYEIESMLKNAPNSRGEGRGAIVNCGSVFGVNGAATWSMYSASKHAVTGMSKTAALDYATMGVRVNTVAPGPIATPLLAKAGGGDTKVFGAAVPMKRIGSPEEVAAAVVWLLSEEASYVTGHTLIVDGGYSAR
jgi:NAD(P)-dependent dehydrogenase (short-subunit alcohol dehydrogenase family)